MLVREWCPRFLVGCSDDRKHGNEILFCGHRTKIGAGELKAILARQDPTQIILFGAKN